jgi:hypothetical protein
MTNLVNAIRTKDVVTENGMTTNSTTLNACVDLFFAIGALRGQEKQDKINIFVKAYNEDALTALKILFWVRDIRGGAGERGTFRVLIQYLAKNHTDSIKKNLHLIPEYGRWDDLLALIGTKLENDALEMISIALKEGNKLTSKWMPRGNGKNLTNKRYANAIRKHMKLTPKVYRKLLADLSNTVEQQMCAKEFDKIKYEHVPSKAMSNYLRAFSKNDNERFSDYLESVSNGETKINSGAIYPYDIIKNIKYGNGEGSVELWDALPNYLEGNQERLLPVVDTSGSMNTSVGNNPNLSCIDVSISLGLYISERNEGPFKDAFITFSETPQLQYLKGTLTERYKQLLYSEWGMSTNLQAVFKLILDKAKKHSIPQDEMPTTILILSDMEFNEATNDNGRMDVTAQEMIEASYEESGYKIPKIIYWNIQSRNRNNPVQFDKQGTALISGFNTSILKDVLSGEDLTPESIMLKVINNPRYDDVKI